MKKYFFCLAITAALLFPLHAQENAVSPEGETAALPAAGQGIGTETTADSPFEARDDFYQVVSDQGTDDAKALIRELELRFNFYSQVFRYSPYFLEAPLKVRAFKDEASYNAYVSGKLESTRPGAVYLHYDDPALRELVIHRGGAEEKRILPQEAFMQYLRAFVSHPPAWIREGFAVYFSGLRYNDVLGKLEYRENLAWLETVKNLGKNAPSLEWVLLADILGRPDNFQSSAWALVSFFMNNKQESYYRTLGEVFLTMDPYASAEENAQYAAQRITGWVDLERLRNDYQDYLVGRKTYNDLLKNGQDAYHAKDYMTADICFSSALNLRSDHYAPYYYLGLISYQKRDYNTADSYYRLALEKGANTALISYARGLNAASAGKNDEALAQLRQAVLANPQQYQEKADALIKNITDSK
ncbi:MAG: hypothetical protein LBT16_08640 [Treponema sp.]|jgi:hypothetical protein|nr:hypothetical protein [Treponema sp.]